MIDNYLFHALDFKDQIMETYQKGNNMGESCGIMSLNGIFRIRPGYFYCFTGWPGAGKSEFVTQLMILQATLKGRKGCIYSPESYPMAAYIETIAHNYLGKSVSKSYQNCCTESELLAALQWINDNFVFLNWKDTPDIQLVLQAFHHCKMFEKSKVFLIDPFNSLTNEDETGNMALNLKDYLNKMVGFTHNENVVTMVVEHPKTPRDSTEATKPPGAHQLFGGTMWWNKSDCMVSVHSLKDEQGRYTSEVLIKTLKMKNQKLNGRPGEVMLNFDIKTNRYSGAESFTPKVPDNFKRLDWTESKKDDLPF